MERNNQSCKYSLGYLLATLRSYEEYLLRNGEDPFKCPVLVKSDDTFSLETLYMYYPIPTVYIEVKTR